MGLYGAVSTRDVNPRASWVGFRWFAFLARKYKLLAEE